MDEMMQAATSELWRRWRRIHQQGDFQTHGSEEPRGLEEICRWGDQQDHDRSVRREVCAWQILGNR